MRLQRLSNGTVLLLPEAALGAGGEARIYAVPPDSRYVAKVYHQTDEARAKKLLAMLANPPEDPLTAQGSLSIAWPLDLLYAPGPPARFAGYLMPRVADTQTLFQCYNPASRRQLFPHFDYLSLHRVARNLAAAVRALHGHGHVIGDVNESNILVSASALITLVDTDSFQVFDSQANTVFRCPVGKPDYTPPELQGRAFAETDRLPEHDLFGVAVLLFQLLMEGTHPFAGIYRGETDPPPYAERIRAGHYAYGLRTVPCRPMPAAPPLDILHPTLRQLFARCFEDRQERPSLRPDARTWQQALLEAEQALIACDLNPRHRFGPHLSACPWCERTLRLGGRDPYPHDPRTLPPLPRPRSVSAERAAPVPNPAYRAPHASLPPSPPVPATASASSAALAAPVTVRMPRNPWAWATLAGALLALLAPTQHLPGVNLLAGLGAIGCGILAFRQAPRYAGTGLWLASTAAVLGGGMGLSVLPSLLREVRGGEAVRVLSSNSGGVRAMSFSPDGSTLAVATNRAEDQRLIGGQITLWNVRTGQTDQTLADDKGDFVAVSYSRDGNFLVAGSDTAFELGSLFLLDAHTRGSHHNLLGQQGHVTSALYSPDGSFIASGSSDGKIRLWNGQTGSLVREISLAGPVSALAFSPDSRLLMAGSVSPPRSILPGTLTLWETINLHPLWTHTAHSSGVLCVAVSPDSQSVASGGNDGLVHLWQAASGQRMRTFDGNGYAVTSMAFAPNGKILAAGVMRRAEGSSQAQVFEILVWDSATGRLLHTLRGHRDTITALLFSSNSHTLASGSRDTTLRLWQLP